MPSHPFDGGDVPQSRQSHCQHPNNNNETLYHTRTFDELERVFLNRYPDPAERRRVRIAYASTIQEQDATENGQPAE
ncbi:hypothetical protein [Endozoicomonas atrinae]|uniref:hypothetical protein n=1 Tax=Endozoicomonas atrinae TaxID=1333660 RepID=UPI0008250F6A|nr:hypothetical protein [Endozoicomonas atrinae]